HQLEEMFNVERRAARTRRRDVDRERRVRIGQAFLDDRKQRAIVHPAPTEKRCYLSTEYGRLLFDATVTTYLPDRSRSRNIGGSERICANGKPATGRHARLSSRFMTRNNDLLRSGLRRREHRSSRRGRKRACCPLRKPSRSSRIMLLPP